MSLTPTQQTFQSIYNSFDGTYFEDTHRFTLSYAFGESVDSVVLCEPACDSETGGFVNSPGNGIAVSANSWEISHVCTEPEDVTFFFGQTAGDGICTISVSYTGLSVQPEGAELEVTARAFSNDLVPRRYTASLSGSAFDEHDEISNYEEEGVVSFVESSYRSAEGTTLSIAVERIESESPFYVDSEITVLATSFEDDCCNAGAQEDIDYRFVAGNTLTWDAEESGIKTLEIELLSDALREGTESFELTFADGGGPYNLTGQIASTQVFIEDVPPPIGNTTITVAPESLVGMEGDTLQLQLERSGTPEQLASTTRIDLSVSELLVNDVTLSEESLIWQSGETDPKTLSVTLLSDSLIEGDESGELLLQISETRGEEQITGRTVSVPLSITDTRINAGTLSFIQSEIVYAEGVSGAQLLVQRTDGATGAVSVDYAVVNGSAVNDVDFIAESGTLNWADADSEPKAITFDLLTDSLEEGTESFQLVLSNPRSSLEADVDIALGNATATVSIEDVLAPIGVVSFEGSGNRELLEGESLVLSLVRSGGSRGALSALIETIDNGAQAGSDYVALSQTITWADGEAQPQNVTIATLGDAEFESNENFIVRITQTTPASVAAGNTSIDVLLRNDVGSPGLLSFAAAQYEVREDEPRVELLVQRTGGADGRVTVNYATVADSAGEDDFTPISGVLEWSDGDTAGKPILVDIKSDELNDENTERFLVVLSGASPLNDELQLAQPVEAAVSIVNVPVIEPRRNGGELSIEQSEITVDENGGSVTITVNRLNGSDGVVSVDYEVLGDSATQGADFTPVSGTLTWEEGDSTSRQIEVPVIVDTETEPTEVFTVVLRSPRSADENVDVTLESASVPVSIVDTTTPGRIGFVDADAQISVREDEGTLEVLVERTGGADGAISVDYVLTGDEAVIEEDFSDSADGASRGTLEWASGDATTRRIVLNIVNDRQAEGNETFSIELVNPQPATLEVVSARLVVTLVDPPDQGDGSNTVESSSINLIAVGNSQIDGIPGQLIENLSVAVDSETAIAGGVVNWRVVPAGAVEFLTDEDSELAGAQSLLNSEGRSSMDLRIVSRGLLQVVATLTTATTPTPVPVGRPASGSGASPRAIPPAVQTQANEALFVVRSGFQAVASLTANQRSTARSLDQACQTLSDISEEQESLSASQLDLLASCEQLQQLEEDGDATTLGRALDRLAPEEVFYFSDALVESADIQITNIFRRIDAIRGGQRSNDALDTTALRLNLRGEVIPGFVVDEGLNQLMTGGSASADTLGSEAPWGFFASGELSVGEVDGSGEQRSADLTTNGLTVGADYRISNNVVVGAGIGIVASEADFTGDEGEASSDGVNLSLFGTWYEDDKGYADAVLDIGNYAYDMSRRIDLPLPGQVRQFAQSETDASTVSVTVSAGRNFNVQGWEFGPYFRGTVVNGSIDGYTESLRFADGAGLGSLLDIASHDVSSLRFSIGAQVTRAINTSRAIVLPQIRLELETESEDSKDNVTAVFQGDPSGTEFEVEGNPRDTQFFNLGVGSSFVFANGKSGYVYYETRAQQDYVTQHSLKFGLRLEF